MHLISRYEEEIRRGRSNEEALRKAMVYTGMGVVTGALTTAGAFLAMAATDFKGIQEMGVICGGGLAICLVPMMTILPVMLLRGRQNVIDHALGTKLERRAKIENLWLTRPRRVIALTLASCIAALIPARKVYFDYNLLKMQSAGLPAVVFEEKLVNSANKSVLYGAIVADSLKQAVELDAKLMKLTNSVASVDLAGIENMAQYLTEDQAGKLALVSQIKQEVADIRFAPVDMAPVNVQELLGTLFSLYGYTFHILAEIPADQIELRKQVIALRTATGELNQRLRVSPTNETAHKLASFQQALFRDIGDTFNTLRTQDDRGRLLDHGFARHHSQTLSWRVRQISCSGLSKKRCLAARISRAVREGDQSVAPNATGTPVQLYYYTSLLKSSYQQAAGYALLAIVILVLLHFRSFACVVLSLLPVTDRRDLDDRVHGSFRSAF